VGLLLRRAVRRPDAHLLDLGCGEGAWLLRALRDHPACTGAGVDLSGHGFGHTRAAAARLGAADRLQLYCQDVTAYRSPRPADVVLCVGSAYAFGGVRPALQAAREHLATDGVLVLGDCFWEREPSPALRSRLEGEGATYTDLPGTVEQVVADGWAPVSGHVSTLREWDDYEWSWTGSLADWAVDNPHHPDRQEVLRASAAHRDIWLNGYRGVLGFVVLLLRPCAL
jgi:SAM-dependent methyltransferase